MKITKIGGLIRIVRGQRVILDSDLAALYGVDTGNLNKAINRNLGRFPSDFMFQLTQTESDNLRFQIGISSWGGRRYPPSVFTEHGVAMLSSVLNSERAVRVNIEIVRAFMRLRSAVLASKELAERVHRVEQTQAAHERELGEHAVEIHEVFAAMRHLAAPRRKKRATTG